MGHDEIRQKLIDRHVAFNGQAFILSRTLFAQVLLDFLAALDFSQMHGRRLIAIVTFHSECLLSGHLIVFPPTLSVNEPPL